MAQGQLLDHGEKALVTADPEPAAGLMSMIERVATTPGIDINVLERLMAMQERILARDAESAFNVAFAAMLKDIPTIIERASTDKARYAPLEDIIEAVRPVLSRHGFSLSFQTKWPDQKTVHVLGLLTHVEGHCRTSEFLSAADNSGSKNAIQALASAVSYGKRYTTKDLLCIVTRHEDDDAESSEKHKQPAAPDGYDAWFATLEGVASEGMPAFGKAWNASKEEFRKYLVQTAPKMLASLRTKSTRTKGV
jgi:hypothetical protein